MYNMNVGFEANYLLFYKINSYTYVITVSVF